MGRITRMLAYGSALGLGYGLIRLGTAEVAPAQSDSGQDDDDAVSNRDHQPPSGDGGHEPSRSSGTRWTPPLSEPKHPKPKQRINQSTVDEAMTVVQSPTELLRQARRFDAAVTLDELTGARLAASEHGSGNFTELCCIVDAEVNRAKRRGMSLYQSLTYKDTFGKQGKTRRASTRRDPRMRHLLASRAVLSGKARGISRGARRFFDPRAQYRAHLRWIQGKSNRRHCPPLVILERWTFGYHWAKDGKPCTLDRSQTHGRPQQWVGEIPGVDPTRLFLMGPGSRRYRQSYEWARKMLIERMPEIDIENTK